MKIKERVDLSIERIEAMFNMALKDAEKELFKTAFMEGWKDGVETTLNSIQGNTK